MSSRPTLNGRPANAVHRRFRVLALLFAFVLACQAGWILSAEFARLPAIAFPPDPESAAEAAANRNTAHLAAKLGIIRGDLWAEYALTYSNVLQHDAKSSAAAEGSIEQARAVAERALALAPYDARIWLILASIDSRFDWLNGKASAALRNSYYTGANETDLIPARLFLSLSLPAISDGDIQQLVHHDLRTIVTRKPEMKSVIADAFQYALPEGKQFINDALKELDPGLLSSLRQKNSP